MAAHKAEAPTWGYDQIDHFLTAPGRYVPGTKMSFAGIRDEQTRINLIAYLRSQGSSLAIPAPDPARQPGAAAPAPAEGAAPADGAAPAAEGAAPAPAAGAPAPAPAAAPVPAPAAH
jgi:cytochrome c